MPHFKTQDECSHMVEVWTHVWVVLLAMVFFPFCAFLPPVLTRWVSHKPFLTRSCLICHYSFPNGAINNITDNWIESFPRLGHFGILMHIWDYPCKFQSWAASFDLSKSITQTIADCWGTGQFTYLKEWKYHQTMKLPNCENWIILLYVNFTLGNMISIWHYSEHVNHLKINLITIWHLQFQINCNICQGI